jgi:hypothetical protein
LLYLLVTAELVSERIEEVVGEIATESETFEQALHTGPGVGFVDHCPDRFWLSVLRASETA